LFLSFNTRFSDNDFGPQAAKFLAEPLGKLYALEKLYLQSTSAFFLLFIDFWRRSRKFDFVCCCCWFLTRCSENNFGPEGAEVLAEPLGKLSALKILDLAGKIVVVMVVKYFWLVVFQGCDFLCCCCWFYTRLGNNFGISTCGFLVSSLFLLKMPDLLHLHMDPNPSICIRSVNWQQFGLSCPPDELVQFEEWIPILDYVRAGPCVPVNELRLMFIGDGEVGKTTLMQAFFAEEHKAEHIPTHVPTVGIDFKPWVFPSSESGPAVSCQLCDFAGQESYYLSHSLHFSRRSLYLLLWTPCKFSPDGSPRPLDTDAEIVGPLKRWLQLLSDNVPEANVVVVGTHYSVNPDAFDALRKKVDQEIFDEVDRLGFIADRQASVTRKVLETQEAKVHDIFTKLTSLPLPVRAPALEPAEIAQFCDKLRGMRPKSKRSLLLQAQSLLEAVNVAQKTKCRLSRMYGLYDGSVPSLSSQVAHLKLVSSSQDSFESFVVDSIQGIGVAGLLRAIEATCRTPGALPFMGEQIPVSWLQVKAALQLQPVHVALGDSVLPLTDAVAVLSSVLKTELGVDVALARCLNSRALQKCIVNFWSPLGEVFVHDGHFLRDPRLIIDFLKPLVNHDVQSIAFSRNFCTAEYDGSLGEALADLQERAVLDHRLFSVVKPWASASTSARKTMLRFFKDCYMISGFDDESGRASSHSASLVTARLCDSSSTPRQEEVRQKIAFIKGSFQFHAVYTVPVEHIGILARLQAMIERLRPREIHLDVAFGEKDLCISRGLVAEMQRRKTELFSTLDGMRGHVQGLDLTHRYDSSSSLEKLERVYESLGSDVKKQFPVSPRRVADGCCVSVRSLGDVRKTPLSSLCDKVPKDQHSHALVVSSTNDGLFAFAAQCIDEIIRSCAFGSIFQSWLPCRPLGCSDGTSWTPNNSDWAQLGTDKLNPKSLSEVLSANANDIVLESHKRRLKDILPRKPPIFMSHTSSRHDGTHVFCQRLKDKLQKKLLCTVWFDENELDGSGTSIQEMQVGMRNASFFVICLTPLYLTRPNCLRELRWALDMCSAKDSTKKMIVLPLHPAVSFQGCEDIIKANRDGRPAHVFLPQPVMPSKLEHIKGHKLSAEALELLSRLSRVGSNADWIKLQPWRSVELGEDWEEESVSWAEEIPAEVDELLENGVFADILVSMATSHQYADFKFEEYKDEDLMSDPPSQDPLTPSDVSAICSCYPRSQIVFSEKDLVSLVHLGLSDVAIMGCVEHGLGKLSVVETETRDGCILRTDNPVNISFRFAAHISGVDFEEARGKRLDIRNCFARSLLFLNEQDLFTIITSPVESSSSSLNVKVSDDDILNCVKAGALLGHVKDIRCGLNLQQVFADACIRFLESRRCFSDMLVGRAPGDTTSADSESFQAWLASRLDRHVVCRVEGTDDVLFVDALLDQSCCVLRSNTARIWNNFSYKHKLSEKQVEMKMRVEKLSPDQLKRERTGVFESAINDNIEDFDISVRRVFPDGNFSWVNVVDSDLKAPVQLCQLSAILDHRWRWGRAIENILLPISAPAAALVRQPEKTHKLFLEVFEKLSLNFLAPLCSSTASVCSIAASDVRFSGEGWLGWHNVPVNDAKEPKHAPMKQFIETLIGRLCSSRPSVAPDMLVLYELFREVVCLKDSESKAGTRDDIKKLFDKFDRVASALPQGQGAAAGTDANGSPSDPLSTTMRHILPALSDALSLLKSGGAATQTDFMKRHNSESFWFPFPRFIHFLTNLCCMRDVPQRIAEITRQCTSAVFQVLCAVLFDVPDGVDLSASILSAPGCPGYLPCNVGTKKQCATVCLLCQHPPAEHKLQHACKEFEDLKALPEDFLKLICRVGSIGWKSHDFMFLIHGREHLGQAFASNQIEESQRLYRQHLQLHVFASEADSPMACTECAAMSVRDSQLPPAVLADISALQRLRQTELRTLIGHMDAIFNGDALKSPTPAAPANTAALVSPPNEEKTGRGGAKAVDKSPPSTKSKNAGGGGKGPKPSDPSPRDAERKLPVALTLDASASSVSRTESQVPLPTALTPPQGAAPTSGASAPQARPSSSQAEDDDDWLGVSDEALAEYLSK
jgi:hypothetical protein